MKSSAILLSLACAVISSPLSAIEGEQAPFDVGLMTSYPGFTLDLDAQRLVQIEGGDPVWMTEMDKVLYFQPCNGLTRS
jgi:leucyl aminopeptidase